MRAKRRYDDGLSLAEMRQRYFLLRTKMHDRYQTGGCVFFWRGCLPCHFLVWLASLAWGLLIATPEVGWSQHEIGFRTHLLNAESEFSAATAIDMNRDGLLDVVSGAWWYAAPDWHRYHFREVEQIRGRFDDYSNLPLDVDGDGDLDIVSVNYRSKSLYWCRNPGPNAAAGTLWEKVVIDEPGTSETGRLADIDGDGRLDILPSGTSFAAWYAADIKPESGGVEWSRFELPPELIGHGVGAGDINGDGRTDIVCPRGWAEAPQDARSGRWRFHADFRLADDCGLPILCHDVDADGDMDLIWGRGHDIGLYWTEQTNSDSSSISEIPNHPLTDSIRLKVAQSKWITHAIDSSWACAHTLMLADMDGDGTEDLVAGKRFMGHDGKDPGENDPLSVHWYRFNQSTKTWQAHLISWGGTCAIDLDSTCVDLDADGDMDILAPSRAGLHWLENLRIGGAGQGSPELSATANVPLASAIKAVIPEYSQHDVFTFLLDSQGEKRALATPLDHGLRRQQILAQMQLVMGPLPESDKRVPLDVQLQELTDAGKYMRLKLTYQAEPGDRVPAYLLIPHTVAQPTAAMLCLHPTHFELGKAQICGLGGQASRFYAHELAEAGFVCLAPDYPGFGDYRFDFEASQPPYASGTMKAIWNNVRALDLLEALPCVDRDKIGAIGHSLGGHNALYTAAFDQRIRCVVSSCGFNAFADYAGGNLQGWSSSRYMPWIASRYENDPQKMPFDFPEVLAAVLPRPMFVNAPLHDSNFPVQGVRKCEASLAPLRQLLGLEDGACTFVYPDAEHDFPEPIRQQAYMWLKNQLKLGSN